MGLQYLLRKPETAPALPYACHSEFSFCHSERQRRIPVFGFEGNAGDPSSPAAPQDDRPDKFSGNRYLKT